MTLTEHLDAIAEKLGVDNLPDRLLTTYLEAFAKNQGVDVSSLQDKLVTTYLAAILNARGGKSVRDNLVTTYLEEIAKTYGVDELVDNLIATYLKEIADAIEDGGSGDTGGVEITHSVYFYDETGANLLYTAVVADGGSGVYGGTIPTKESTAQYTYTFANAWSLTPGGTADSNALENITEDRNVYAVFNKTARTYTVYWYNGSNLLETDTNVPYGTTPIYNGSAPVDEGGGTWSGWQPGVAPVTGDVSYVATFKEPASDDPWAAVASSIAAGTYKTDYAIGDMIPLDLGSEGIINMQIVAFDADELADGSGTAAITWVAKELLATMHKMNPAAVANGDGTYLEGTGSVGGWEKSELRQYLLNTISPQVPQAVAVVKKQDSANTVGEITSQETTDAVWIPGKAECFDGGIYTDLFVDSASRKKTMCESTTYYSWFLRDAYPYAASKGPLGFYAVSKSTGNSTNMYSNSSTAGVCIGFCTGRTPA